MTFLWSMQCKYVHFHHAEVQCDGILDREIGLSSSWMPWCTILPTSLLLVAMWRSFLGCTSASSYVMLWSKSLLCHEDTRTVDLLVPVLRLQCKSPAQQSSSSADRGWHRQGSIHVSSGSKAVWPHRRDHWRRWGRLPNPGRHQASTHDQARVHRLVEGGWWRGRCQGQQIQGQTSRALY